jgi:hypothetical protein
MRVVYTVYNYWHCAASGKQQQVCDSGTLLLAVRYCFAAAAAYTLTHNNRTGKQQKPLHHLRLFCSHGSAQVRKSIS